MNGRLFKHISLKGKNYRKFIGLYKMEDGSHTFLVETKKLQDFKLRIISETSTIYKPDSLRELSELLRLFFSDAEVSKALNRELGQAKKANATTDLNYIRAK
jgi:phosphoenolpyruvate synthase/pyruvate phosphate dikinase